MLMQADIAALVGAKRTKRASAPTPQAAMRRLLPAVFRAFPPFKRASAQRCAALGRSVALVAQELRLHYERWKALRPRAPGMGAFHDFAVAAARAKVQEHRSTRRGFGAVRLAPAPDAELAVERWYGEGGNTQTRVARRGR